MSNRYVTGANLAHGKLDAAGRTGKSMSDEAIRFQAQIFKIGTLIDGGLRLTLDLCAPIAPETIIALFDSKQPGIILECAAVAVNVEKQQENNAIYKGSKRKSEWTPAKDQNANSDS
jgi:hypothetical protein